MAFVKAQDLGGAMFWELSGDDDAGTLTGRSPPAPDAPATDPCA
jgi:GH18 family chitinase